MGFSECPVKMCCEERSGPRSVSAVWSLEVVASQRLAMYNYKNGIFNRDLKLCPLYGFSECPLSEVFNTVLPYGGREGLDGYRDQIVTCDVGVFLHSKVHPPFMKHSDGISTQ